MTPTPHTDLNPGDVVLAATGWRKYEWSVFTVVKVTAKRVIAQQKLRDYSNDRYFSTDCDFYRVAMSAADAETALRHLTDRHKDALRTLNQQHTDRIMKLIGENA